jgi:hypothetical protein
MTSMRAAAFIAVLAVIGLVVSVAAVWPQPTPDPPVRDVVLGPPVAAAPTPQFAPSPQTDPPDDDPRPVRVSLPGIAYRAPVRPVGVASDGQMELPPDPRLLGWYRFGPAPSQRGSTVLAGHLDSRQFGLGPLVRLRAVEPGDAVDVVAADGTRSAYSVVRIKRFDRQALPARLFTRSGPERVRLITCGGGFDAAAGGYQRNLVVTAVPR